MDMSSIELIPEHCRFINDGYINPISVLANTMVASFPGSFRKRQPRNEAKTVRYSGSIAVGLYMYLRLSTEMGQWMMTTSYMC